MDRMMHEKPKMAKKMPPKAMPKKKQMGFVDPKKAH